MERNVEMIREELATLDDTDCVRYAPAAMHRLWMVHLMHFMGVAVPSASGRCVRTRALVADLPRVCLTYSWGDALFSVHSSDSHLRAHCSADNLRVRRHLDLKVPAGCSMRVGRETTSWQEGRALLFQDSYEHDVWNRGEDRRAILIVDFWHPDLTATEIEALVAGFCKSEVRSQFLFRRVQAAQPAPTALMQLLATEVARQDLRPEIARYWS